MDAIGRKTCIPPEGADRRSGNVGTCTLVDGANRYIVGYGCDTSYTMSGFLCSSFLPVGIHRSRQGDDAILDGYADFVRLYTTIPTELGKHVCLKF
jgi:hypothetical protein